MHYWTNIFTASNWQKFLRNGSNRCGFPEGRRKFAEKVKIGDMLICYIRRDSKFCGVVEVKSDYYFDSAPMYSDKDPYPIRFNVVPIALKRFDEAISPKAPNVWKKLAPLVGQVSESPPPSKWCNCLKLRANLINIDKYGRAIHQLLCEQQP